MQVQLKKLLLRLVTSSFECAECAECAECTEVFTAIHAYIYTCYVITIDTIRTTAAIRRDITVSQNSDNPG